MLDLKRKGYVERAMIYIFVFKSFRVKRIDKMVQFEHYEKQVTERLVMLVKVRSTLGVFS